MLEAQGPNAQQISYWNEVSGPKWVRLDGTINTLISPLGSQALAVADAKPGESVLDVGCGCGQTTVDFSSRVGPQGHVVGIDVSAPMLDEANARCARLDVANVRYVNADAQTHSFAQETYDLIFSRFGVMFFSEPDRAFGNLRTALREDGRLVFICWQNREQNPWMTIPAEAAAQHFETPAPGDPSAPGPFSLWDPDRIAEILESAGFGDIVCRAIVQSIDVSGGAALDETVAFLSQMGPSGALLRDAAPELRRVASESIRDALVPHMNQQGAIELGSAAWIVTAHPAPARPLPF